MFEDEVEFSSGTYRIDAVRILHLVAPLANNPKASELDLEAADTKLANWMNYLPDSKRRLIQRDGEVDEMMFGAHMIVSAFVNTLSRLILADTYQMSNSAASSSFRLGA
jgi:hypothetical protein